VKMVRVPVYPVYPMYPVMLAQWQDTISLR